MVAETVFNTVLFITRRSHKIMTDGCYNSVVGTSFEMDYFLRGGSSVPSVVSTAAFVFLLSRRPADDKARIAVSNTSVVGCRAKM